MGILARRHWLLASVCAATLFGEHTSAWAQCSNTACGSVPLYLGSLGGNTTSIGAGVSADGRVVVGHSDAGGGFLHAFRWTPAGMTDLGAMLVGSSQATGVSADGKVVVGINSPSGFNSYAFRWTDTGGAGTMQNINGGTFTSSSAWGVSADGKVVVGDGLTSLGYHAFRWTDTGGLNGTMTDIHDGTVFTGSSFANGVSANGSVVVGYGYVGPVIHAFRWTDTGGAGTMTDIHDGAVFTDSSAANGVSADGRVVVGEARNGGVTHAFRWTEGSGKMQDINGGGFLISTAVGVSADGGVIVGQGETSAGRRVFRWTAASGMTDLGTLLANAGVNMSGIALMQANAISANGEFITGQAQFPGVASRSAYLVRYQDGVTGLTTAESLLESVSAFARARGGVMAQQHGFAAPLLGADRPIGLGTEAGVFAAAGSATGGGYVRYGSASGLAVLGGIAYSQENYARAEMKDSVTAAAAVQYVYDTGSWWRPFVEAGGWLAPGARLTFERSYINGAGTATGKGATRGDLSYYYGRAGILLAQTQATQIGLSAEIGRERLKLGAYGEQEGMGNPFPAAMSAGTDRMNVVKARVQASYAFNEHFDATVYGAWAHGFDRHSDIAAYVLPFGAIASNLDKSLDWFEYGVRVGYRLTEAMTLDVFANGVSGHDGIGTRVHGGAGLRVRF